MHKHLRRVFLIVVVGFVSILSFLWYNKDKIRIFSGRPVEGVSNNKDGPYTAKDFSSYFVQAAAASYSPKTKKELILKFCDTLLFPTKMPEGYTIDLSAGIFEDGFRIYDPKQSVFLYYLCNYVSGYEDKFHPSFENTLKDYQLFKDSKCQPDDSEGMNGCKLGIKLPKFFNKLMNEYSNIKQVTLFGFSADDIDKSVIEFSNLYFGEGVCGGEKGANAKYYLYKENLSDIENNYCSHPKTYQLLNDYFKHISGLISKTNLLDYKELVSLNESGKNGQERDLLMKGLIDASSPTTKRKNFENFKNLIYNELMYYNIFLVYYSHAIATDLSFGEFDVSDNIMNINVNARDEVIIINREIELSKKAIFQMERLLSNIYTTFPIHIGLMAYYEDLKIFRSRFARIYTPYHQMYYKLQNVSTLRR